MRNTIRLTLALALMLVGTAWSRAALADVFVFAEIDKDKNVTETVTIDIIKTILVNVTYNETVIGDAEAHTLINQDNHDNTVDGAASVDVENPDQTPDEDGSAGSLNFDIELDALIEGSITGNSGVVGVNQDVGNMVNQANAVSLGETVSTSSITESQAHGEQRNHDNSSIQYERLTFNDGEFVDEDDLPIADLTTLDPDKTALITGSVNDNTGIVGVNQNAGNNNNQANGVALAVGFGAHVAMAEADLGQHNASNTVLSFETLHTDTITGSINGNSGVVTVNQTTGNNNNQGSMVSFSALTTTIDVTVPGTGS